MMKKAIICLLTLIMIFSLTLTCFAESRSMILDVLKNRYAEYNVNDDDFEIEDIYELSNGCVLFNFYTPTGKFSRSFTAALRHFELGDYIYFDGGAPFIWVTDGETFDDIPYAYEKGMIDDKVLAEIAEIYPGEAEKYYGLYLKSSVKATEAETKAATADSVTPTTVSTASGPAVKTGENPLAWATLTLSVTLLLALGIIRLKKSKS